MIEAAALTPRDTALEIGPGQGGLTEALLESGARVIAVEKDDRLIPTLRQKFSEEINSGQLTLIHDDIINFLTARSYNLEANYKLVANIPYYLTGQIIRQFLTADRQPRLAVLMLQKEVGERIIAKNDKESLLSISVKAYGQSHYLKTVPAKYFSPRPKVDSAIVLIDKINKDNFREVSEEKFFELVKRGFAAKRKMLRSKLGLTAEELAPCGVAPTARAENLTVGQWFCLAKIN